MAIYRLMAIKNSRSTLVSGMPALKFAMMSLVAYSTHTSVYFFLGVEYSAKAMTMEFCHGYSSNMYQILDKYRGFSDEDINFGISVTRAIFVVGQLVIVARLGCYLAIFLHMKKHNDNCELKSMLPIKELKQRHDKNVISLYGQVVIFALELVLSVIFQQVLFSNMALLPSGSYSFMIMIVTAVVSVVRITMASPELRRFYF